MKFQTVDTDQYQPVGEEFEASDMTEALDIVLREHGITVQEVEVEDDEDDETNDHITILNHDISYYLDDGEKIELGDSESEHIEDMIGQGYVEGELNKVDGNMDSIGGHWKIVKK